MRFRPALVAVMTLLTLPLMPPTAHADSVPFADPDAQGYLGFCDINNKPITSGPLDVHPFVAKVVSSLAAPDAYGPEKGGKATLYAFQPREQLDPGEWSNAQMTGSSRYTNKQHPMSEGTILDFSMGDMVMSYPPKWDNLLQLRLMLTAPDTPMLTQPYAASVIRIVGDRWEMVNPQTLPCDAGTARSFERDQLPASTFVPTPSASTNESGTRSGRASAGATRPAAASSRATPSASASSPAAGVSVSTAPAAARVSSGVGSAAWVAGAIVAIAIAAGGLWWSRARRS